MKNKVFVIKQKSLVGIAVFFILSVILLVGNGLKFVQAESGKWAANGVVVSDATGDQYFQKIIYDGSGNSIVVWEDYRGADGNIYAQKLNSNGTPQWTDDGVVVTNATGDQSSPMIISAGSGNSIIVWEDYSGAASDIYAQRLDSNGNPQWTANGIVISNATGGQYSPQLVSDGAGGAIIAWVDERSGDSNIYAQKINSTGTVQWTGNGVVVSDAAENQYALQLISDGASGAIITWQDYRSGSNFDIYAQKLNSSGTAQWTEDGIIISDATGNQSGPKIISDNSGGAIIVWKDSREGNYKNPDIYAQRINSSGTALWTEDGEYVANYKYYEEVDSVELEMVTDDSSGAIITWQDYRSESDYDIYAQRLNSSGGVEWIADGVVISNASADQRSPKIVADGSGGAIITWEDYRSDSHYDIYAQHINSSGVGQWTANGFLVADAAGTEDQYAPQITSAGTGEAIIAWEDYRPGTTSDIYAQWVTNEESSPTETTTETPTETVTVTPTLTETSTIPATPTETNTTTKTPTESPTETSTNTETSSDTPTETNTATETPTNTYTITDTPTSTNTITHTPTETSTITNTETETYTITNTPTETDTITETSTGTFTDTPTDTITSTLTETLTPTNTLTHTFTITNTPTNSPTLTNSPTNTYTSSNTFTSTNTPTSTFTRTSTHTATNIPVITSTFTQTWTSTSTHTPTSIFTPSYTPTDTTTNTPTGTWHSTTPTFTPTFTFTFTPTATRTFTPTGTWHSATPTFTKTRTPTATKTATPITYTPTPIPTSSETHWGSADKDNDGMPDEYEEYYHFDPNDEADAEEDFDHDGLSNLNEFLYGTNPTDLDTDGGGVSDGEEIRRGMDPLNPDTGIIEGVVFDDKNRNGIQDTNELGIANVVVILRSSTRTTTTNSQGNFTFLNVSPGAHTVEIDQTTLASEYRLTVAGTRQIALSEDSKVTLEMSAEIFVLPKTGPAKIPEFLFFIISGFFIGFIRIFELQKNKR